MAYNLAGNVITQSGTDNSDAGLGGIAGVVTIDMGDYNIYDLGARDLNITGNFNVASPKIITSGRIIFSGTSNSILGTKVNNVITTTGLQMHANFNSGPWNGDGVGLGCWEFQDNCNVTIYGGVLYFGGAARFAPASVVRFEGAELIPSRLFGNSGGKFRFFAENTGSTSIINCLNRGMLFDLFRVPDLTGTVHIGVNYGFQALSAAYLGTDALFEIFGFDILEKTGGFDIDNYNNADLKLVNAVRGSELTISNGANGADSVQGRMYKQLNVLAVDPNSLVSGMKLYIEDNDNGNRQTGNKSPNNGNIYNFSATQNYSSTSNNQGVFGTPIEVLTAFYFKNGQTLVIDRRGKSNVPGEDKFDSYVCSYSHLLQSSELELKGSGVLVKRFDLTLDPSITEQNRALVSSYTENETPYKAYDSLKDFLWDNFNGQTETIATRSQDTLNARGYDVVIDRTATLARDFDGTTITLKANTFTGNITTTGTVTLLNGATIIGGIIDSNGDSFLSFTGDWEVYATEADRNTSTSPLGTGDSNQVFRFTYSAGTSYYMWVEGTKKRITPTQTGETSIDLSVTTLLTLTNKSLGFIPQVIYVDKRISFNGDGSNSAPFNNIDDAIDLFNTGGYTFISLKSSMQDPALPTKSMSGVKIQGVDKFSVLNFNNQSLDGATFINLLLFGQQLASDVLGVIIEDSRIINNFVNFKGIIKESEFVNPTGGGITVSVNGSSTVLDSSIINASDVVFDLQNSAIFGIRNCDGDVQISNLVAGKSGSFELNSGNINFDSTCTGGVARVNDSVVIKGTGNGSTIDFGGLVLDKLKTTANRVERIDQNTQPI